MVLILLAIVIAGKAGVLAPLRVFHDQAEGLPLGAAINRYSHPSLISFAAEDVVRGFVFVLIAHTLRFLAVEAVLHDSLGKQGSQCLGHGYFDVLAFSGLGAVVKGFQD